MSNNTFGKIFSKAIEYVATDILAELPKKAHIKRNIRNHRSYHNPKEPQNIQEIVIHGIRYYIIFRKIVKYI